MCGLQQGRKVVNERQGVAPLWLAFGFWTSIETRQLILHTWKDYNKWYGLDRFSSASCSKPSNCDPRKQFWMCGLEQVAGVDTWTAGGGTILCLAFGFLTSVERWQLILYQWKVQLNDAVWLSSPVLWVSRKHVVIQKKRDCVCGLEQIGVLINA